MIGTDGSLGHARAWEPTVTDALLSLPHRQAEAYVSSTDSGRPRPRSKNSRNNQRRDKANRQRRDPHSRSTTMYHLTCSRI